jgi:hypothetical protein
VSEGPPKKERQLVLELRRQWGCPYEPARPWKGKQPELENHADVTIQP